MKEGSFHLTRDSVQAALYAGLSVRKKVQTKAGGQLFKPTYLTTAKGEGMQGSRILKTPLSPSPHFTGLPQIYTHQTQMTEIFAA